MAGRGRRLDGRHAGPRVGGHVPRAGGPWCPSPRRRRPVPSRSSCSRVGRLAIELDPKWRGGDYYDAEPGDGPHAGLALARMIAQITYRSDAVFEERFGRDVLDQLEDVHPRGSASTSRATSTTTAPSSSAGSTPTPTCASTGPWTCTTSAATGAASSGPCGGVTAPTLILSICSDTLYPRHQQEATHAGLLTGGAPSYHVTIDSPDGHDGFLIETESGRRRAGGLPHPSREERCGDPRWPIRPNVRPRTPRPGPSGPGATDNDTAPGPDPVGDDHVRDPDRRTRAAAWPRRSAPTASTAATATRRCRASRRPSPSSRGPRAARAFASGMGAMTARRARPRARRATTSSPSASSTPAPSCCCRRSAPASAST